MDNQSKTGTAEKPHGMLRFFVLDLRTLRIYLAPLLSGILQIRVDGAHNAPSSGGVLLVCREKTPFHAVLHSLYFPRRVTHLADYELFALKERLLGYYNDLGMYMGMPLVWRLGRPVAEMFSALTGDGLKTQLLEWELRPRQGELENRLQELLAGGRVIALAPSTESLGQGPDFSSGNFEKFAARTALNAGVPLLPAAFQGSLEMPASVLEPFSGRWPWEIRYRLGEPLGGVGFAGQVDELAAELFERLDRLQAEA